MSLLAVLAAVTALVLAAHIADSATVREARSVETSNKYSDDVELEYLSTDGTSLDILIPIDVWGLPGIVQENDSLKMTLSPSQRIYFSRFPSLFPRFNTSCSCENWTCGCCGSVTFRPGGKNRTACGSITLFGERLTLVLKITVNNRTLIERDLVNGTNPPPFCIPIPQLPVFRVCARFTNISITHENKMQVCGTLEAGLIFTSPWIRLRFGCIKLGKDGVAWSHKPMSLSSSSTKPTTVVDSTSELHQFASALNSTDSEQLLLLQSILRQPGVFELDHTTLPTRSQKMAWSKIT